MLILIKDEKAIKKIAIAGNIIFDIFSSIEKMDLAGLRTMDLNDKIDTMIKMRGATPAFFNYHGFPGSCCISLNSEVVHGIPNDRKIRRGDLVKIDIGVEYQDYIADAAKTFAVDNIPANVKNLLSVTRQALKKSIEMAKPGNKISDISRSVQTTVEENGFNVVRELTGHGVGKTLHEEPMIPNFIGAGEDPIIEPGMVFAIEPMVNMGGSDIATAKNGWTILTKDGSLSCHYEDTVAILEKGNINLTRVMES